MVLSGKFSPSLVPLNGLVLYSNMKGTFLSAQNGSNQFELVLYQSSLIKKPVSFKLIINGTFHSESDECVTQTAGFIYDVGGGGVLTSSDLTLGYTGFQH